MAIANTEIQSSLTPDRHLYFSALPNDLFPLLFSYFSSSHLLETLDQLRQINDFDRLFKSKTFWNYIWRRDISSFLPLPEDPYQTYQDIIRYKLDSFLYRYDKITYVAENGYDILLLPLLSTMYEFNRAMVVAASKGHVEIVNLMLQNGATQYNYAMANAATGGHIAIVELMLELGANNYNDAMANAAYGGHIEIIRLMLERGADNYIESIINARLYRHMNVVDLIESYLKTN